MGDEVITNLVRKSSRKRPFGRTQSRGEVKGKDK
jgi:hypothetical protein